MNYPESVRFLYALGNEVKTAKLGLDRIAALLARLGDPHRACRVVHVAGTNGKGSVCAMIESALRTAGQRTGLFTSPHLVEPTERIRINGEPVDTELFARAFDRVHCEAEALLAEGSFDLHPTYFETVTAMAFVLFRDLGVETTVLEVGLGGRLDATNVVTPMLCVITPIDFDHEVFLGRSLEAIASEKAGILKPGVAAVIAVQRPGIREFLEERAAAVGATVKPAEDWEVRDLDLDRRGSRFLAVGAARIQVECTLAGEHQVMNARTAVAALHELGIPGDSITEGIRRARWPGRLECVCEQPEIILDGAHNPSGARALAGHIRRFYRGRRVRLIYGCMRDKAVTEMAGILFPLADEVILTAPDNPRAVRPQALRELVDHPHLRVTAGLREALGVVDGAAAEDAFFITGTLFLVGEARGLLVK
jgi:dihydrofolate synthase / folylpolyglutamate synthase